MRRLSLRALATIALATVALLESAVEPAEAHVLARSLAVSHARNAAQGLAAKWGYGVVFKPELCRRRGDHSVNCPVVYLLGATTPPCHVNVHVELVGREVVARLDPCY